MRPDEHKQKKSSQYKKKHGMQTSKTDKQKGASTRQETGNQPKEQKDTDIDEVENPFAKRKVKSNWNKYEEEDESLNQIGEDYEVLMSYASQSNSHLKLKSEKEWDFNEEVDDALTIDCEKIADALSQLTFCERYGFDSNDFEPSLLKILDETSASSTFGIENSIAQTLVIDKATFDFQAPISVQEKTQIETFNSVTNKSTVVVGENNDDADTLLHSDKAEINDIHDDKTLDEVNDLECDLDDLLLSTAKQGLTAEVEKQTTVHCDNIPHNDEVASDDKSCEEDLEDWLDSVI